MIFHPGYGLVFAGSRPDDQITRFPRQKNSDLIYRWSLSKRGASLFAHFGSRIQRSGLAFSISAFKAAPHSQSQLKTRRTCYLHQLTIVHIKIKIPAFRSSSNLFKIQSIILVQFERFRGNKTCCVLTFQEQTFAVKTTRTKSSMRPMLINHWHPWFYIGHNKPVLQLWKLVVWNSDISAEKAWCKSCWVFISGFFFLEGSYRPNIGSMHFESTVQFLPINFQAMDTIDSMNGL